MVKMPKFLPWILVRVVIHIKITASIVRR